jgi:hypothetical protein
MTKYSTYLAFNTGRYYGSDDGQPIEAALISTVVRDLFEGEPELGTVTMSEIVFYDRVRGLAYKMHTADGFTEQAIMAAYDDSSRPLSIVSIDRAITLIEESQV